MPPAGKSQPTSAYLDAAAAIKGMDDGEYLSELLVKIHGNAKDIPLLVKRQTADKTPCLGKKNYPLILIPLDDIEAVHRFMTEDLKLSSKTGVTPSVVPVPVLKGMKAKQVTAKMYFKDPAGFSSLIEDALTRLRLTPIEARKVKSALFPCIMLSTSVHICLDARGEVIGVNGIDRNGIHGAGLKIETVQVVESAAPSADDW